VDRVCEFLRSKEIKNLPFYDDSKMTAQMRHTTLNLFQTGKLPVMVCNNLAARGLDTNNVQHLVQFDYPKTAIDYLQRVGRCGRRGAPGLVTNFVRKADREFA
jgi:superfamily II DNA/RNA helicase